MDFVIIEKSVPVKGFHRTRKGKIENVHQFERKGDKHSIVKSQARAIVDKIDNTMKLFRQTEGMCGPTSIKIAISEFGKSYSVKELARIAHSTAADGTDNEHLIKAIRSIGINVVEYQDLNKGHAIEVVKQYCDAKKPVIVSWLKTKVSGVEDAPTDKEIKLLRVGKRLYAHNVNEELEATEYEHYSVVKAVDDEFVYMLDPMEKVEQKLPIKYFLDRWSDSVYKRWFIALELAR
jgi:hypothetical protein